MYVVCIMFGTRGFQGPSNQFQGGVGKVYILHVVSWGVWGHAPSGKLDARRSLLRLILGTKSLQFLANGISIGAACALCGVVIAECV